MPSANPGTFHIYGGLEMSDRVKLVRGDRVIVTIEGVEYPGIVQIGHGKTALVTIGTRNPGSLLGAVWCPKKVLAKV